MMYGYYGDWGMHSAFGGIFSLLIWIGIIILIVWIVKNLIHTNKMHEQKSDNALNILKERYAKGEIEKEEFETKKKDLA